MRIRFALLIVSAAAVADAHPHRKASPAIARLGYQTDFDLVTVAVPAEHGGLGTGDRYLLPAFSDLPAALDRRATRVKIHGRQVRLSIPI